MKTTLRIANYRFGGVEVSFENARIARAVNRYLREHHEDSPESRKSYMSFFLTEDDATASTWIGPRQREDLDAGYVAKARVDLWEALHIVGYDAHTMAEDAALLRRMMAPEGVDPAVVLPPRGDSRWLFSLRIGGYHIRVWDKYAAPGPHGHTMCGIVATRNGKIVMLDDTLGISAYTAVDGPSAKASAVGWVAHICNDENLDMEREMRFGEGT